MLTILLLKLLKKDYKDDLTLKDACELAIKVLSKTMDASNINSEKLEFATLSFGQRQQSVAKIWNDKDIDILIKASGF